MPARTHLGEGSREMGPAGIQGQAAASEVGGVGWDMGRRKVWQGGELQLASLTQRSFGHSRVWGSSAVQGGTEKESGKAEGSRTHGQSCSEWISAPVPQEVLS